MMISSLALPIVETQDLRYKRSATHFMEPLLCEDDVLREVVVVEVPMRVLLQGTADHVGAEEAVSPLEGVVGVVEVRPGDLGLEGVPEPEVIANNRLLFKVSRTLSCYCPL